jgi:1,4-alpha-glucan branching enzyme
MVKKKKSVGSKGKAERPKQTHRDVEFTFYTPESMNVYIAGIFNRWDTQSLPMKKGMDGVWRSKVKLLPGCYEYKLFATTHGSKTFPMLKLFRIPLAFRIP